MAKEPAAVEAFLEECELARGSDSHLDSHLDKLKRQLAYVTASEEPQLHARHLAENLALALDASLLIRHAPGYVADAYCAGRLGSDSGRSYGTLPGGVDTRAIIERALPS
jgi:putative acyl-CoA dehydrogenase